MGCTKSKQASVINRRGLVEDYGKKRTPITDLSKSTSSDERAEVKARSSQVKSVELNLQQTAVNKLNLISAQTQIPSTHIHIPPPEEKYQDEDFTPESQYEQDEKLPLSSLSHSADVNSNSLKLLTTGLSKNANLGHNPEKFIHNPPILPGKIVPSPTKHFDSLQKPKFDSKLSQVNSSVSQQDGGDAAACDAVEERDLKSHLKKKQMQSAIPSAGSTRSEDVTHKISSERRRLTTLLPQTPHPETFNPKAAVNTTGAVKFNSFQKYISPNSNHFLPQVSFMPNLPGSFGETKTIFLSTKENTGDQLKLTYCAVSRCGNDPSKEMKENQDNYGIFFHSESLSGNTQATDSPNTSSLLAMVMDGHGPNGKLCSTFVRDNLPPQLQRWGLERFATSSSTLEDHSEVEVGRILHNSCVEVNASLRNSSIDTYVSGTTMVMLALLNNILFVANVGDSRAVLGRIQGPVSGSVPEDTGYNHCVYKYEALDLSCDHKPDRADEHERIRALGGRVFSWGVPRVWLKDADVPGLAMSRSFGDSCAETVGVVSEPEVTRTELDSNDKFVVMGSDGLWEFISSQEAVDIVGKMIDQGKPLTEITQEIIKIAVARWEESEEVVDDCTCVVLLFH